MTAQPSPPDDVVIGRTLRALTRLMFTLLALAVGLMVFAFAAASAGGSSTTSPLVAAQWTLVAAGAATMISACIPLVAAWRTRSAAEATTRLRAANRALGVAVWAVPGCAAAVGLVYLVTQPFSLGSLIGVLLSLAIACQPGVVSVVLRRRWSGLIA